MASPQVRKEASILIAVSLGGEGSTDYPQAELPRVLLFDGVCNLCSWAVRFIMKRDPSGRFRFASLQSVAGQDLLLRLGIEAGVVDTVVLIEGTNVFLKSTAVLRVCRHLPIPWRLLAYLNVLPVRLRDWCYDRIAATRYDLFGRRDSCLLPTDATIERFLDDPPLPSPERDREASA